MHFYAPGGNVAAAGHFDYLFDVGIAKFCEVHKNSEILISLARSNICKVPLLNCVIMSYLWSIKPHLYYTLLQRLDKYRIIIPQYSRG